MLTTKWHGDPVGIDHYVDDKPLGKDQSPFAHCLEQMDAYESPSAQDNGSYPFDAVVNVDGRPLGKGKMKSLLGHGRDNL
ncbi:hypothetical protein SLA2020_261670 [Shorea laevis]